MIRHSVAQDNKRGTLEINSMATNALSTDQINFTQHIAGAGGGAGIGGNSIEPGVPQQQKSVDVDLLSNMKQPNVVQIISTNDGGLNEEGEGGNDNNNNNINNNNQQQPGLDEIVNINANLPKQPQIKNLVASFGSSEKNGDNNNNNNSNNQIKKQKSNGLFA